jgi:F0F1-type ATP synthase membrane subunit c/vacuolar-type H+-ATPase subunit K
MIHLIATHYITLALLSVLPVFFTAVGQARIGRAAIAALNKQPGYDIGIKKIFFAGIALSETVALITLLTTAYLFTVPVTSDFQVYARFGACVAVLVPALLMSYLGSFSIVESLASAARQPFLSNQILSFMLITQSLMQTPVIFCAIFALIIQMQAANLTNLPSALQLMATGIMLALCSVGPCIGLSYFITHACTALRINRAAYSQLFSFTFISQAIIETPFLLGLATAIVLLQLEVATLTKGIALICAAVALGGATLPVSIASAHASARVLEGIAYTPAHAPLLGRFSIFCQAFIDTTAIYGLIIALLLISL